MDAPVAVRSDAVQRAAADIWITSYDLLKRDVTLYETLQFDTEIIDEAQNIKNHGTQAAQAVKKISARVRFALTGTPIEALRDNSTTVDVPVSLLGSGAHYCLEVQGDSMVEAGIQNGDVVIIKSADTAESGEIVVALIDDTEATLKRLRKNKIQPYFVPGHVHQLEIIERLVRSGVYMGPLNVALCGYGGGSMGRNPFDWMEMLRRTPHGASSVTFWSRMRGNIAIQTMATVLGVNVRVGNEDNIWDMHKKRWPTVKQVEWAVKQSEQFGRKVATAEEARKIMKVGVWYDSIEETLFNAGLPPNRPEGYKGFLAYETDGKKPKVGSTGTNPVSIL